MSSVYAFAVLHLYECIWLRKTAWKREYNFGMNPVKPASNHIDIQLSESPAWLDEDAAGTRERITQALEEVKKGESVPAEEAWKKINQNLLKG